jgi:hypothetical protein
VIPYSLADKLKAPIPAKSESCPVGGPKSIRAGKCLQVKFYQRIARRHGCDYVEINRAQGASPGINNGNYQAWFETPNRGDPSNGRTSSINKVCRVFVLFPQGMQSENTSEGPKSQASAIIQLRRQRQAGELVANQGCKPVEF